MSDQKKDNGKHEDKDERRRDSDGLWNKDRGIPPESDPGKHGRKDDKK